jgi:hypothetical protein
VTVVRVDMYVVACDHPGCEKRDVTEEYVAWTTPQAAHEVAITDGGWISPDGSPGGLHYCSDHTAWCEECDEQKPMVTMVQDTADKSWYCKEHAPAALALATDEHNNLTYETTDWYPR